MASTSLVSAYSSICAATSDISADPEPQSPTTSSVGTTSATVVAVVVGGATARVAVVVVPIPPPAIGAGEGDERPVPVQATTRTTSILSPMTPDPSPALLLRRILGLLPASVMVLDLSLWSLHTGQRADSTPGVPERIEAGPFVSLALTPCRLSPTIL